MMGPMMGCAVGWIVWLVFLALVVAGVVVLIRALGERPATGRSASSALAILEERFARGEVDRQEFEERRGALRS